MHVYSNVLLAMFAIDTTSCVLDCDADFVCVFGHCLMQQKLLWVFFLGNCLILPLFYLCECLYSDNGESRGERMCFGL